MTKRTQEKTESSKSNKLNLANIVRKKTDVSLNWKLFKSTLPEQKKSSSSKPISSNHARKPGNISEKSFQRDARNINVLKAENIPPKFSAEKIVNKDTLNNTVRKPVETPPKFGFDKTVHGDKRSRRSLDVASKISNSPRITRHVAMDCEMVGVDDNGKESILARVSLVNKYGDCIYDKFVKPREPVTDYRTKYSGVREKDLVEAEEFEVVQKEVADIIEGRVLVGHALSNDLRVLFLSHPRRRTRDTSTYRQFRKLSNNRTPSLKKLAAALLGVTIQQGEHDSVVDANTAMQLYLLYRKEWEKERHLKKMQRLEKLGK